MGVFKILGCAAIGIGAAAAVPFTGGGSVLGAAALLESLSVGSAVAGAAAGTAAGVIANGREEDELREQHEEGFKDGIKKGNIETAKKMADMLEQRDALKIGVFALAFYVAKRDGEFSEEEQNTIEKQLGRPDGIANKEIADVLRVIFEHTPTFNEITEKYLNKFALSELEIVDDFIKNIIQADGIISQKEIEFLDYEWVPYMKIRNI